MNPFPKNLEDPSQSLASQEEQLMQMLQSNPELMQKYQEEVAKFQAQAKKAQHPPMTSKEYRSKLDTIEKYFDEEGGLTIQPSQAFVLKFLEKRSGEKIFVNIVTHDVIDHPEEKLLVDFENQPGLRIPMSMGKIREDSDKHGGACKVVDVVLNPVIVATAETNPDILLFTAQIIGNYLLEKYKIAVNDETVRKVKGLKYKGSKVEFQRVRGRKAPKIEQVSEEDHERQQKQHEKQQEMFNELNNPSLKKVMRPDFQVLAMTAEGKFEPYSLDTISCKFLKILIELPHLINSRGIHLQGSNNFLFLSVKNFYELCLKMPYQVGSFKCRFSKKQRQLQVRVFKTAQPISTTGDEMDSGVSPVEKVNIEIENDLLYDLV